MKQPTRKNSASTDAPKGETHPAVLRSPLISAPYGHKRWQVAAALSAAVTITKSQGTVPFLSGGTKPEAKTPLQRHPLFGRRGLGRRGFSQRSRLLPRVSPPNRLFGREREGGSFSTEKLPPSQYYLLSYPNVRKSSMRLRQSGRTLTQSFRLTCRPRSFSMSARASLPIC